MKSFPKEKKERLNAAKMAILKDWFPYHVPIPPILYHYTTAEGLIGILNSASLWMTNLRYMNDLSELQYAINLIAEILEAKSSEYSTSDVLSEFFRRAKKTFNPFEVGTDVFAICFCENGNLLSQWRAYGGKEGVYAIGIDFYHLIRFLSRQCLLRKVIYAPDEQHRIITNVIDKICSLLDKMTRGQDVKAADADSTLPLFCQFLRILLGEYIFCFKHPEFSQEQEWRLVYISDCNPILNRESDFSDLKFRTFNGNVIPFYEVSFQNAVNASRQDDYGLIFPIQELVIGPTVNPEFNRQSVVTLLTRINPDHFPIIKKSGTPLRWL